MYQESTGESTLFSGEGVPPPTMADAPFPLNNMTVQEHTLYVTPTPAFHDLLNTAGTEKTTSIQ